MTTEAVREARRRLGRIGVGFMPPIAPADAWRRAARRVEDAGYGTIWMNELIGGREVFAQMSVLLAATERIALGSAIANLWARHPAVMQGAASVLADAYPGRVALGVGVSVPSVVEGSGQKWNSPLTRMREYLDGMDASVPQAPAPDVPFPRLLAALGPKMQRLARDRADGALPAMMPIEHTRRARDLLGPDKLLVVMRPALLETDPEEARGQARRIGVLAPGSPHAGALKSLGYADADLADGGSDKAIDACFSHGDEATVAADVAAHLDAGADHVSVTVLAPDPASAADQYERLAPHLVNY